MRIPIFIFCFLLSALSAVGQFNFSDLAFVRQAPVAAASSYYPTNIGPAYAPVFVYDADSVSGSAVASWPDYAGGGFALTNTVSKGPNTESSALNGHNTAKFNGTDCYMRAGGPDVSSTYELVMVARLTNGANKYFFYTDSTPRVIVQSSGSGNFQLNAGASLSSSETSWNEKFMVWNLVVTRDGTNGFMSTNNVLLHSAAIRPSVSATNEFRNAAWSIGSYWLGSAGGFSGMDVAWIGLYPTNLSDITERGGMTYGSVRSNLFSWLTNRFGLDP